VTPKRGKGGRPIPHLRYAAADEWIVVRGGPKIDDEKDGSIRWVAKQLISCGEFAGEQFSAGDEFIVNCAGGSGPQGSPSSWRKANIIHHITRVVLDLAEERRVVIAPRPSREKVEQPTLFGSEKAR
jgi:hypothetical protein